MEDLTIQNDLRPELPHIYAHIDYRQFRDTLIKIDEILTKVRLEDQLIEGAMEQYILEEGKDEQEFTNSKVYLRTWKELQYALRCNVARHLTGESYRKFSTRLTDSILFQWFTGIHHFTNRKAVSKSAMERYDKLFDESMIAEKLHSWQSDFLTDKKKVENIGLKESMNSEELFIDSTCVKANIHFPVDWVLLRDGVRSLLLAIKQAHERIIGERQISSEEKILSLYDPDVHVIVRGKSGGEVEFGQGLLLTEQRDGLIIDWKLFQEQPKADSALLQDAVNRIKTHYRDINSIAGDKGFYSKDNDDFLKQNNIRNAICPKSVDLMQEKASDPKFLELQKRRSQTEARIGIFKNAFLSRSLKSKGLLHRKIKVTWCVITHNLWVIARKALADEKSNLQNAA